MRLKVAVLATGMLLAGAVSAEATVTVQISGSTLAVFGSEGADEPRLRYAPPAGGAGYSEIFDNGGVLDPLPAGCVRTTELGADPAKTVYCEDGGTATELTRLEMSLAGGADDPALQACFAEILVDAGEGANRIVAPDCDGGQISVTSGAGQDTLWGPNGNDPPLRIAIYGELGAGDDNFDQRGGGGASLIHGQGGNDYLVGGHGNDELLGEDGNDKMLGRGGDDKYDGGNGDDVIGDSQGVSNDDDPGSDDLRGGADNDELILDGHGSGVTITIDEAANDGASGEGDNVHNDIEKILGTTKNDVFTGGPGRDTFDGYSGQDTIHGGDGPDDLIGGSGDDKVYGDGGADKVQGMTGADTVDGGAGPDQLYGDIAACSVFCSFDSDLLLARDGETDSVDCGSGADTAQVDGLDVVAFCAVIDRQGVPGGGGGPGGTGPGGGGPGGGAPAFSFSTGTASVAKGAVANVTCPAACGFTVTIVLSAKTARKYGLGRKAITIGTARGSLLAAGRKKVTVKLTRKAKRKLRRARGVAATLKVSTKDAAGKSSTQSKAIRLGR